MGALQGTLQGLKSDIDTMQGKVMEIEGYMDEVLKRAKGF